MQVMNASEKRKQLEGSLIFLVIMGSDSLDVFDSFQLTQAEEANYETITEISGVLHSMEKMKHMREDFNLRVQK